MPAETDLQRARSLSNRLISSALFFSIFTNLLMLTGPLFMLQVYDRVLGSRSEETLVALFGLVAGLYLLYGLLEFARGRVMARVAARFQAALNTRVFGAVLERRALRQGTAGRSQALQDLDAVRTFLGSPVLLAIFDMPWTPVFLAAIFIFHPYLGWLAVAGGGLLIVATVLNQVLTQGKTAEAQRLSAAATGFSRQAEEGGDFLWAQGMAPAVTQRWEGLQTAAVARATSAADWTGSFASFSKAFRFFLQSAMLALGAWLVLQAQLTAGAMIAASILLGRALAPIDQGLAQWPVAQRARAGWQSLSAFLQEMPARQRPTDLPDPEARLSVQNLTVMTRPGDPPILRGIGFEIAPGEALGVIGKSGAGKTTLARTIVGLTRPTSGTVRLGGATLAQYGAERFGQLIGYLPQEVRLFDGTVAENIAQMDLTPDPKRIVAAAQKARVHETILGLPEGYETQIGAAPLSGGQKQRLALARALYRDPVLLVLDEPNSALDAEGSEALNTVIAEMKAAGKAVLIMTHRPNAISACDTLLVIDTGRQAALGPRDEVIRSMIRNAGDVAQTISGGRA